MKIKYFENILKYLPVLLVCIFIGLLGREHFIKKGADEFTVNMIFWIYVGLGILIFAILNLFLDPIVSWLLKRFSKNVESELVEKQESDSKNLHIITSTENFKLNEEPLQTIQNSIKKENPNFEVVNEISLTLEESEKTIELSDIEKIRSQAKSKNEEILQEKLDFIMHYTKEKFAPHSEDEEINKLCIYLVEFLRDSKFDILIPLKVNNLKTIDLMHFGWNVWNHYRGNNQRKDVAKFLKIVFSENFKEMEESTIEKLLTSRKEEGVIKIENNMLQ